MLLPLSQALAVPLLPWRHRCETLCVGLEASHPATEAAHRLALHLNCPLLPLKDLPEPDEHWRYVLAFTAQRVELRHHWRKGPGPVFVDLAGGAADWRRQHGGGRGEWVARAVGLRKGVSSLSVLDATAGLGQDAFVLASLGCRLTMLERNPIVYTLLADGLARLAATPGGQALGERMQLLHTSLCNGGVATADIDVVYLDPMFPEREKSSLVRKEMRLFHDLVGEDDDDTRLLEAALALPVKRVVVKRPRLAPAIAGPRPDATIEGKRCRFDLYARQRLG